MRLILPLLALLAAPAAAQRAEVPIRLIVDQGGVRRYAVSITVGGQPIEAGLDTGSTGLRLLAPKLPGGGGLRGPGAHYSFGAGVAFDGPVVSVPVAIGPARGDRVRVQRIDKLSCNSRMANCKGAALDVNTFGIMGDQVAGQGFPAILGIGMRDDPVANPLVQLGVTRWIVELPRSPAEAGRLVLDPDDDEVASYRQIRFIAGTNMVAGCVTTPSTKLCAPSVVDTGASGIRVQGGRDKDVLPQGTDAVLTIGDDRNQASLPVTIGRRDQAAGMRLYPARADGKLSLSFGIAPYLRWSVLYDARAKTIGVLERH